MSAASAKLVNEDGQNYREVIGPARFLHNDTYLICDTAYWYVDGELIKAMGNREMSAMEIMAKLGLKNRANFRKNYLVPALDGNFIVPTSNIKNNPRQKYRLANR